MSDTRSARSAGGEADTFTVGDLLRVIQSRTALILRTTFIVVALAAVAVFLFVPTLYTASATVMLDTQKNNVADVSAVLSMLPADTPTLQNQIQVLTSRDLATEVIASLKLYDDPEFNGQLHGNVLAALDPRNLFRPADGQDSEREVDRIISAFRSDLSADALGLSTSIAVTFTAHDPEKAARIANAIVDTYVADQLRAKRAVTELATRWLESRIAVLAQQAQETESAAERFKTANHLAEAADGTPLVDQQMAALSAQLMQARTDLVQKEATSSRVSALAASGNTAEIGQVISSPEIVELRKQEADLIHDQAQFATRYGQRHPKMIAAETQRRALEDKVDAEVQRTVASLHNDVEVSRTTLASLGQNLAAVEQQAQAENLLRVKLKALEANAVSTRATYDTFVTRLRETQDREGIETPDAHVISHAAMPLSPKPPGRLVLIGASVPLGLLLGLVLALLAERSAVRPARTPSFVRSGPAMVHAAAPSRAPPVVAELPNAGDRAAADMIVDWPRSAFAVGIAALLQRVTQGGREPRFVVVTATDRPDARGAITVALARAAALCGTQAIIIDGDDRRSAAMAAMGLAPANTGLSEVLAGQTPLSDAVQRDPRSGALVLSGGRRTSGLHAAFASPVFTQLVAHLKQSCKFVIVHASPGDALALASSADALLLVVDGHRAHSPQTFQAVDTFAQMSNRVGVVLAG